jgi:undecaprenyl-diphosphatase
MAEPTIEPTTPVIAPEDLSTGAPGEERRGRQGGRRGRVVFFWDIIYGGLRTAAVHAHSLYLTVGIFLLGGAVIAVIGTLLFAMLGEWVQKGGTQAFDVAILQWLGQHRTAFLTAAAVELTYLGTGVVVLMVVGVAALFLWHTEHRHSARLLLAAVAGNILLNGVLKLAFHRQRPDVFAWQTHATSSSFPSGHAMSATVCYGTVAYLVTRLQKHHWSRVATLTGAVILILLICLTRLYLGVHYPSDVIGGIVVGLAWAGFCMATLEASLVLARHRAPRALEHEQPAPVEATPVS